MKYLFSHIYLLQGGTKLICSIFGSTKFTTYKKLYEKGRTRGDFSYGGLFIRNKNLVVTIKTEGTIDLEKTDLLVSESYEVQVKDFNLYLGHTQAPTSCQREYNSNTTHPFCCNEWIVAHNGVLTNSDKIKKRISNDTLYNVVDTSLIPALLYTLSDEGCEEIESIVETLSYIEGTYGLWIHNKLTCNTYIARCGSTLYSNFLTNDFSSVDTKGMQSLVEGTLYLLTAEGVTEVGGFDTNSPFLVI